MVLATHQMQGSSITFPSRNLSSSRPFKLRRHLTSGKKHICFSIKHNLCLSVGACVHGHKARLLKIASFKGSAQSDESGGRTNGSKFSKSSVKVSYVPKESGETVTETPKAHGVPVSYTSEANDELSGSPAIQSLFKKWLKILRSPLQDQVVNEILGEGPLAHDEVLQTQPATQNKERHEILKIVFCYFMGLDATIKIPLVIFIPMFLAVNLIYGTEVSKELTPLWILGPLVVALYVKMLRGLWALYVFSFNQTVKMIKNLPTYYAVASSYMLQGKLKEDVGNRILQPVVNIKNLDYKDLSRKKMNEFKEWFMKKYLDYVESIWPYYCRTIRFLKRANLI